MSFTENPPVEDEEKPKSGLKKFTSAVGDKAGKAKDWICETMVDRPCVHCGVYWGSMALILIIILAGGYLNLAQIALVDFQIGTEKDVQNDFALNRARELVKESGGFQSQVFFRAQPVFTFGVFFLYETTDGSSVFSSKNLQTICRAEKVLLGREDYPLFCITDPKPPGPPSNQGVNTVCSERGVQSAVTFYAYGQVLGDCELLPQEVIDVRLKDAFNKTKEFPTLVSDTDNFLDSTVARSTVILGGPLGKDSPPFEDFTETESVFLEPQAADGYAIIMEEFKSAIFEFAGVKDGVFDQGFGRKNFEVDGLKVRVHGFHLEFLEFMSVVTVDSMISAGSFLVVTTLVLLYTGSCFFSFVTMMGVALSVIVGLFLYAVVLQIDYFNNLHVVVLFIILAIGANNIFVLVDAWRQSESIILEEMEREDSEEMAKKEKKDKPSNRGSSFLANDNPMFEKQERSERDFLVRRLKYAYVRAAASVANTAGTTTLAFIATVTSQLAPIAAFGLFGGLVIFVNWVYMLNIHPAALMIHHFYILKPWEKRFGKKEKKVKTKKSYLSRLFDQYIFLVNNTYFPYVSLLVTVAYGITMTVFAFQLETPTSVESNFKDDHMFTNFQEDFNEPFTGSANDTFSLGTAVFGIRDLDQDGVERFSTDPFRGEPVFDEDFEIFSEESQNFVLEFCDQLPLQPCSETGCMKEFLILDADNVDCWIKSFRKWHELTFGNQETFTGGPSALTPQQVLEKISLFVRDPTDNGGAKFQRQIGLIDGEIKFVTVTFRKSMKEDQPLKIKQPVLRRFEEFADSLREDAPEGMQSFYITSFDFVWQHTEEALVSGLYSGMAVSLFASFLVVLAGTRHCLVSLYAISGVGAIVFCVLGSVQTMGWELGTAEALAGVMVIGLAVDYTVHLGYMFIQSRGFLEEHDIGDLHKQEEVLQRSKAIMSRESRVEEKKEQEEKREVFNEDMVHFAVDRMGVTILAGAGTTLSSGVFLLLCTLAFFSKMAVLIIFTVVYSTVYAFAFFVPMLRVLGPGKRRGRQQNIAQNSL